MVGRISSRVAPPFLLYIFPNLSAICLLPLSACFDVESFRNNPMGVGEISRGTKFNSPAPCFRKVLASGKRQNVCVERSVKCVFIAQKELSLIHMMSSYGQVSGGYCSVEVKFNLQMVAMVGGKGVLIADTVGTCLSDFAPCVD